MIEDNKFGEMARKFRDRLGISRNRLAHQVGVDPSYLTRIEAGDRYPPRHHIVVALCRSLKLTMFERNQMMTTAGYAPASLSLVGSWNETMEEVSNVLCDHTLTTEELEDYQSIIVMISKRWRNGRLGDIDAR